MSKDHNEHNESIISLVEDNDRAGTGRGRPNLSRERPNSQAPTGTGKIFLVVRAQLATSRIGSHIRLMPCLLDVMTINTCPLLRNTSGCGKRKAHKNWFMVIREKAAPVTRTTLRTTGPVPVDSRQ